MKAKPRNLECPATGTACEDGTCKRGLCQIEERKRHEWEMQERERQERAKHPALAAIVERLVEKLKRTNPGCFRQPRP